VPLYTVVEAARVVDVPSTTLARWAKGYVRRPPGRAEVAGASVVTFVPPDRQGEPSIPFVGLAEALVLAAVRRSGVPMQRVWPALLALQRELGVEHALASRKLYTDGAELLFGYGESRRHIREGRSALDLVVVRSGQHRFPEVIGAYLRCIEYADDGYPRLIHVPAYEHAEVVVDPGRAFGAPVFERGGARVDDVLGRFWAAESLDDLSEEFGVPASQLVDVVRVASRRAA
jgi:uncharacterized protein (DUF433 family)